MPSPKRTASPPTLIAFLFKDVEQKLQVLHLAPRFQLRRSDNQTFELRHRKKNLPANFFGPSVSSITALVGKNSSGKSTAMTDIARMLTLNGPVTSGCSLIVEHAGHVRQLRQGLANIRVIFDGADIPTATADHFPFSEKQLKIVYFSSSFDPMQRKMELLHSHSVAHFVDISSQYFFNFPGRPNFDLPEKLAYLQTISQEDGAPLELSAEGVRKRTISFDATLGYARTETASSFLALLAEHFDNASPAYKVLRDALGTALAFDTTRMARELALIREGKGVVKTNIWQRDVDYFDLLQRFLEKHAIAVNATVLLMVAGRLIDMHRKEHNPHRQKALVTGILRIPGDFDGAVGTLLGPDFLRYATILAQHATIRHNLVQLTVTIDGKPSYNQQLLLDSVIALQANGVALKIDFNGLSDGQRSLLSFAARYAAQEMAEAWPGNTLLLIDEHEQGLHPEWQRQFIKHLCSLVAVRTRSAGRTQVILSSHSPFVVSDLPDVCVNVIGGDVLPEERTFGGNLLELLLSPLFMERTTGEFAAEKIKGWLDRIRRLRDPVKLREMAPLIDMIGDTLLRNYLNLAVNERLAVLKQKAVRRD